MSREDVEVKIKFSIFSFEIFCLELENNPAESLADLIADLTSEDEEEEQQKISGGPTHNFDRDNTPADPLDRYTPWEDKGGFGFVQPVRKRLPREKM